MSPQNLIVDPRTEFLAVRHSYLNGNNVDLERAVDETLALEKYTPGRAIVPCLEADFMSLADNPKEVVLTHDNFSLPSTQRYRKLYDQNIARSFHEALDAVADYKARHPQQRLVLCLEAKARTSRPVIQQTVRTLQEYGFTDREAYFDSFDGSRLDLIAEENKNRGTNYQRSWHYMPDGTGILFSRFSPLRPFFPIDHPTQRVDLVTRHIASLRKITVPYVQGGVGSVGQLQALAENPLVLGAYLRIKEKNKALMLLNSTFNLARWRRVHFL